VTIGRKTDVTPMTETCRDQMSPRESPNTCFSLRATTRELMLATTTSLSLRATTLLLRTTTRELILMLSSVSLRATTPVRPTPGGFFFCLFCQAMVFAALCNNLVTPCDNEVEHGQGPSPDVGEGTAPKPHAR
jgi:hypothetical protein